MSGQVAFVVADLVKRYGSTTVIEDASVSIHERTKVGLIGRNGAGKSTLCRMLLGQRLVLVHLRRPMQKKYLPLQVVHLMCVYACVIFLLPGCWQRRPCSRCLILTASCRRTLRGRQNL